MLGLRMGCLATVLMACAAPSTPFERPAPDNARGVAAEADRRFEESRRLDFNAPMAKSRSKLLSGFSTTPKALVGMGSRRISGRLTGSAAAEGFGDSTALDMDRLLLFHRFGKRQVGLIGFEPGARRGVDRGMDDDG